REDRPEDGVPARMILAREAGDLAAAHHVHHRAAIEEWRERVRHGVVDMPHAWVCHRPWRAGEQVEEVGDLAEERGAVTAGVRVLAVLDERAVRVEAVAARDVGEDIREAVAGAGELRGVPQEDSAERDALRLPDAVRAGAYALADVERDRVRGERVDRAHVVTELRHTEMLVE